MSDTVFYTQSLPQIERSPIFSTSASSEALRGLR